jgi:uncharacterized protein (TIGR02757 family)
MLISSDIKDFLKEKADYYNNPHFIPSDPVSIPHSFSKKEDIEISGFMTAMISWGQRKTIINNAHRLMRMMDHEPLEFVLNAGEHDMELLKDFRHRTFNGSDCIYFIHALRNIYQKYGGLESAFLRDGFGCMKDRIASFRRIFFELPGPERTRKHLADPSAGSSAKRINMFLRWMVRRDDRGVDFGLWQGFHPRELYCPLDVHSGNVARKLGLLQRNQNDWQAVEELTDNLRLLDQEDPVKYDYALFGLGVFEKF